jgi:cold shock protein
MEDNKVYSGIVIWFNKGYGFISWQKDGIQQEDLFLHFSDINTEGYKTVYKDQKVEFQLGLNKRGQLKATSVSVIK